MQVRRLRPDEWETYRSIRLRALVDAPNAYGATVAEEKLLTDERWRERADDPDRAVFVVDGPDDLVGLAVGGPAPDMPDVGALYSMWVAPSARGTGVGRALIGAVQAWAIGAGYRNLGLGVTTVNQPAIALYERVGFRDIGERYPLREGTDLVIQIMAMPLPGPAGRSGIVSGMPDELAAVTNPELTQLRLAVEGAEAAYLADLARLVDIDCGSYTKAGVDEVGRWVAARFERLGGRVVRHAHETYGDTIVGTFEGAAGGRRVLLIGHMDTVFDPGTAAARPFHVEGDRAYGPGVTDMKSGLLAGIYALEALLGMPGRLPFERLTFVANPDEEIGSPTSTPFIRDVAADVDACFVLECARANGDIVSSRKGIVDSRLVIHGRAAHAGVEPEKGRSAILAAAYLVPALHALTGRWPGVTCNVGVIAGGTRPNVVAEETRLEVDLRAVRGEDLDAATDAIRELIASPGVPDVTIEMEVMAGWRPMEKLERSGRLVELAVEVAGRLGFELKDAATGGASDANTTAGMGVPSLDGLGPIGGGDHAPAEYLELDSVVPRTTLVAGLLLAVARDPVVGSWRAG